MQSFFTKNDTKFVKAVLKFKKEREKMQKRTCFVPEQIDAQELYKIQKNKGGVVATQL